MDRDDRRSVIGTWPRHHPVPPPPPKTDRDPRGWKSHHTAYEHPNPAALTPEELLEAIRARAYAIWQRRVEAGHPGTALEDWLQAERELGRS